MEQVTFTLTGDVNVQLVVTEMADGTLKFDVTVLDDTGSIADLNGLFFDIADDTLVDGLMVSGDDVTDSAFNANKITKVDGYNNVNGEVVNELGKFDGGVQFGTSGIGVDDIRETSFTLSHDSVDLTLDMILSQDFAVRLTSVGEEGGDRDGSLKIGGEAPADPDEPPVDDPDGPTGDPDFPTDEPDGPTDDPDGPTDDPDGPTDDPDGPTGDPDGPTEDPDVPTGDPDGPTEDPDAPTGDPDFPTEDPDAPTGDPDGPAEDPDAPTGDPDGPTEDPDAPTGDPDFPTDDPDAPTGDPDGPTEEPDGPTDDPDGPSLDDPEPDGVLPAEEDPMADEEFVFTPDETGGTDPVDGGDDFIPVDDGGLTDPEPAPEPTPEDILTPDDFIMPIDDGTFG